MNKVLVTGATGFIGHHLVRALKERGDSVSAIIQPGVDAGFVKPYCDRMAVHDLRQPSGLEFVSGGYDCVFHLAAFLRDWGPYRDFEEPNVSATRHLAEACRAGGCGRFLLLGSLSVHRFKDRVHADGLETPDNFAFGYTRSKLEAERVLTNGDFGRLSWTIIRPGFWVFGPGDVKSTAPICRAVRSGRIFFVRGARKLVATSYVGNLVDAVCLAASAPQAAGKTLVATDDNQVSWMDIFEELGRIMNSSVHIRSVPYPLAYAAGWANEWIHRAIPAVPLGVTRYRVEVAAHDCHWATSPLLHELGYQPKVAWQQALEESARWFLGDACC
ncbi:MAG: NAD-dependent epimerase/dehydratase family protein [Elusimicrobia bacterium]|nr:NAD-dependent epimerase/dehydratase family protein [Elusimicrobiota bacterium]